MVARIPAPLRFHSGGASQTRFIYRAAPRYTAEGAAPHALHMAAAPRSEPSALKMGQAVGGRWWIVEGARPAVRETYRGVCLSARRSGVVIASSGVRAGTMVVKCPRLPRNAHPIRALAVAAPDNGRLAPGTGRLVSGGASASHAPAPRSAARRRVVRCCCEEGSAAGAGGRIARGLRLARLQRRRSGVVIASSGRRPRVTRRRSLGVSFFARRLPRNSVVASKSR